MNLADLLVAAGRTLSRLLFFFTLGFVSSGIHATEQSPALRSVPIDQAESVELARPHGLDPLTPSEKQKANDLAERSAFIAQARRSESVSRPRPRALAKLRTLQLLYSERQGRQKGQRSADGPRLANVYYYHYGRDEVVRHVIDLSSQQVRETHVKPSTEQQPPITSAEAEAAVQLILDHPVLGRALRGIFKSATGRDLNTPDDLQAQVGLYFAQGARGTVMEATTRPCIRHRCVQLLLPIGDDGLLDTDNLVVDLSAGRVLWLDKSNQPHSDQPS